MKKAAHDQPCRVLIDAEIEDWAVDCYHNNVIDITFTTEWIAGNVCKFVYTPIDTNIREAFLFVFPHIIWVGDIITADDDYERAMKGL
jgi:hypothetical protein